MPSFYRILIDMGLLIFGHFSGTKDKGDKSIPPLTTNVIVAFKTYSEKEDEVALATIVHASGAVLTTETLTMEPFKEMFSHAKKIMMNVNSKKVKNSPVYSRMVEILWPVLANVVFLSHYSNIAHIAPN